MRFIDSNIFIHAWLKPKRELSDAEIEIKRNCKSILKRVEKGEKVVTSVVHISEIANILEANFGVEKAIMYIETILGTDSIEVLQVVEEDIIKALELNKSLKIGLVDSLAVVLMNKYGIEEIYTQDKDFIKASVNVIRK